MGTEGLALRRVPSIQVEASGCSRCRDRALRVSSLSEGAQPCRPARTTWVLGDVLEPQSKGSWPPGTGFLGAEHATIQHLVGGFLATQPRVRTTIAGLAAPDSKRQGRDHGRRHPRDWAPATPRLQAAGTNCVERGASSGGIVLKLGVSATPVSSLPTLREGTRPIVAVVNAPTAEPCAGLVGFGGGWAATGHRAGGQGRQLESPSSRTNHTFAGSASGLLQALPCLLGTWPARRGIDLHRQA